MRAPEQRQRYPPRAGEGPLQPEAFTILPPEDGYPPPVPPSAPQPHRLTPSSRRHKNMSFAILGEPGSRPGSRSPSPTGRVSPFRGHGFNPAGSRHASPAPSPPPPEEEHDDDSGSSQNSKIPKLSRRGSASVFGEKIEDFRSSPNKRKLANANQLSQSLTNIASKRIANRPPPSPRRQHRSSSSKAPAFQRLSPIVGSSPEPSQSQSSPSNKSRSQPQSRFSSPSRSNVNNKPPPGNYPTHNNSRPVSRNPSRRTSREPSPSKNPTSPTRIPVKHNYRNVQAKVNSYNKPKPKVPPKPEQVLDNTKDAKIDRKESVSKMRTNSRVNLNNPKSSTKEINNTNTLKGKSTNKPNTSNKNSCNNNNTVNKTIKKKSDDDNNNNSETKKTGDVAKVPETPVKLTDLLQPSATTVVSSTTSTVTQPLKIDAKLENTATESTNNAPATRLESKTISPMVDGRVLSATSVSHAMNKMNDTVLDSQTLMKEHGLTKLSPAASAIIAMSNENPKNPTDTKSATLPPTIDSAPLNTSNQIKKTDPITNNNTSVGNNVGNHVTTTGLMSAKALEEHVQNNMSKLISPDHVMGNSVQKSVNDRIREARTVVANDVKPIKIMVKGKPMDVEVQSGNIRFDATNGLNERPGLPPTQNSTNNDAAPESQNQPQKVNVCSRFLSTCRDKMTCNKKNDEEIATKEKETEPKPGCFSCCRKKKPDVTINVEDEDPPTKCWDRIKCCGRNKVKDKEAERKDSWKDGRDSILSDHPAETSKNAGCGGIFRKMFCLDKCRKKQKSIEEDKASRRASMMSKKKSLTPSVHPEEHVPKLDISLVEHSSVMKGAIPVLPISLAWFCLVMNCLIPGTGTIFSGMFCLCLGIPRFSQKDGAKQRIGSFLINLIIGIGQCFTVLFCLVGWGWSIWWGVIMIKIAKKHQRIKALEEHEQKMEQQGAKGSQTGSHQNLQRARDPERGS